MNTIKLNVITLEKYSFSEKEIGSKAYKTLNNSSFEVYTEAYTE